MSKPSLGLNLAAVPVFGQDEVFDVPKAETEAVVEPDGVADDFRRKTIAVVTGRLAVHRAIVPVTVST